MPKRIFDNVFKKYGFEKVENTYYQKGQSALIFIPDREGYAPERVGGLVNELPQRKDGVHVCFYEGEIDSHKAEVLKKRQQLLRFSNKKANFIDYLEDQVVLVGSEPKCKVMIEVDGSQQEEYREIDIAENPELIDQVQEIRSLSIITTIHEFLKRPDFKKGVFPVVFNAYLIPRMTDYCKENGIPYVWVEPAEVIPVIKKASTQQDNGPSP